MKIKPAILLLLGTMFTGCITEKKCSERFPPKEIHTIEKNTETITKDSIIPGTTIREIIRKDSIAWFPSYKIIRDTSGRAELRFYRDAYGNLIAECTAKDITVEKIWQIVRSLQKSEKAITEKEYRNKWWVAPVITLLCAALVISFFKRKLPKLNPLKWIRK